MNNHQMIVIMQYFQAAYSKFYENANPRDVLKVWYDVLKDEDPVVVNAAAKNYVKTHKYPPTVADIMEQIELIKQPDADTDLWGLIYKAVSNGLYNSEEEFNKLPPECQSFLGSPSALKDLAMTDTGTMNTVVKGQFLKRVEAIREHQAVQRGLPAEVRAAITESKRKMLEGGCE